MANTRLLLGAASFSRVLVQAIQLATFVMLARVLTPSEFGYYAVCTVVFSLSWLVVSSGMHSSLMLNAEVPGVMNSSFMLNVLACLSLSGLVFFSAGFIEAALGMTNLAPSLRVTSLAILASCSIVPLCLLERVHRVWLIATAELSGQFVVSGFSIFFALRGHGSLGLAWGLALGTLSSSILLYIFARYKPALQLDGRAVRSLRQHGARMLGFGIGNYLVRNIDNFIVATRASAYDLGLYSRGYTLALMPVLLVGMVVGRVVYPMLLKVDHKDRHKFVHAWRTGTGVPIVAGISILVWLACVSGPLIEVLFGAAWREMSDIMCVLALAGIAQIFGAATGCVFQAMDCPVWLLRLVMLQLALVSVSVWFGSAYGALGVAVGVAFASWGYLPLLLLGLNKICAEILHAVGRTALLAAAWAACVGVPCLAMSRMGYAEPVVVVLSIAWLVVTVVSAVLFEARSRG